MDPNTLHSTCPLVYDITGSPAVLREEALTVCYRASKPVLHAYFLKSMIKDTCHKNFHFNPLYAHSSVC